MQLRNPNNIRIIDISHHQGTIDWPKVAADGVKGVFIKATEGIGYIDPLFRKNVQGAIAAGLKVGFYHFAHPDNSPVAEAKHFTDTVKGLKTDLPLVLDLEQAKGKTGYQLTTFAASWLDEVERLTTKRVMLYTGASFAKTYLGAALSKWPLWVAHYNVNQPMANATWNKWAVFQYTSSGKVNGIVGNVDVNEMELSYWMEITKSNPQQPQKPVDKPASKTADATTQLALKDLQAAGVIQTPEYWAQNAFEGGTVRGDYAALLIQRFAAVLKQTPSQPAPKPNPTPTPKPEEPAKPKPWEEIEMLTKAASVYVDLPGGGTAVVLKNGYLLTAKHVSCGKPVITIKTKSRQKLTATLVAEHPGIGKDDVDLALYRISEQPADLPYLTVASDKLEVGQKLLTVEAEVKDWVTRTGEVCLVSVDTWPWKFDCSIAVNKGNSGGALVNQYGQLVGIVIQMSSVTVKNGGVTKAVPGGRGINLLYPAVSEWLEKYM